MFSCCWEIIFPVWGWIAVLNENKASAVYSANMKLVSTELGKNSGKIVENSSMRKGGGVSYVRFSTIKILLFT